MDLVQSVVVGVLQGVFEWLPVSSEAVVSLVLTKVFGEATASAVRLAVWLHLGTMGAALVVFWEDSKAMLGELVAVVRGRSAGTAVFRFVVVATLLTGLIGGAIYLVGMRWIAGRPDLFTVVMGAALLVTGFVRWYGEKGAKTDVGTGDAVLTGALQGLSIIPGLSRSGTTVFGLLYRGFSAQEAFRLSFLLSIPAVLAANIGLGVVSGVTVTSGHVVAAGVAMMVGYASIHLVLDVADRAEVAYVCFVLAGLAFVSLLL